MSLTDIDQLAKTADQKGVFRLIPPLSDGEPILELKKDGLQKSTNINPVNGMPAPPIKWSFIDCFIVDKDFLQIVYKKKTDDPLEEQVVEKYYIDSTDDRAISFWADARMILQGWARSSEPLFYIWQETPVFTAYVPEIYINCPIPQGNRKVSPTFSQEAGDGKGKPLITKSYANHKQAFDEIVKLKNNEKRILQNDIEIHNLNSRRDQDSDFAKTFRNVSLKHNQGKYRY